jgi:hypothetical protein
MAIFLQPLFLTESLFSGIPAPGQALSAYTKNFITRQKECQHIRKTGFESSMSVRSKETLSSRL